MAIGDHVDALHGRDRLQQKRLQFERLMIGQSGPEFVRTGDSRERGCLVWPALAAPSARVILAACPKPPHNRQKKASKASRGGPGRYLDSRVASDRELRMSENTDWTLIVRASQQAKVAAEAAVASAKLLESEAGHRLSAMEARLGAIEGRIANLAAGQNSHELAIMRIADTQADHTARLTRIETLLTDIARKLGA